MLGYYKAPEATAEVLDGDGWYYTGDLATMDEHGYIRIVGRKKELIIRGGQNIYPAEIERHLLTMPIIDNAAIVGVPHPMYGESVWAYVIPTDGAELTANDVLKHCRNALSPYKIPQQVRIIDSLPLTSTQKVQKFRLREMAEAEMNLP